MRLLCGHQEHRRKCRRKRRRGDAIYCVSTSDNAVVVEGVDFVETQYIASPRRLCGYCVDIKNIVENVVERIVENVVEETQYIASSTPDNAVVVDGVDILRLQIKAYAIRPYNDNIPVCVGRGVSHRIRLMVYAQCLFSETSE
jgi:hypothetical protein